MWYQIQIASFKMFFSPNLNATEVISKHNIIFVESGLNKENVILTSRQACSFESAAITNPDANVNLIFIDETRFKNLQEVPIVKALRQYKNFKITAEKLNELSKGSPMEGFIKSDILSKSKYIVEHTSDLTRLMVLWKYGGTYMDSDVIVQQSLQNYPQIFACAESDQQIDNGFMRFEGRLGRELIEDLMTDVVTHFNPDQFVANGPFAVTNLFKRRCRETNVAKILKTGSCNGLHVLGKEVCYEISYPSFKMFFDPQYADEVMKRTNKSLITHYWNFLSKNTKLLKNSTAAYIILAKKFCPKVYEATGEYF